MNKFLILILLIPMISFGDFDYDQPWDVDPIIENKDVLGDLVKKGKFDVEGALNVGYSIGEIEEHMKANNLNAINPNKKYNLDDDGYLIKKDNQQRIDNIKYSCSIESGHAKNEYSAKKIYDNCLKMNDIKK